MPPISEQDIKLIVDDWYDSRSVLLDRDVPAMSVAAMIRDGDRLCRSLLAMQTEVSRLSEELKGDFDPDDEREIDQVARLRHAANQYGGSSMLPMLRGAAAMIEHQRNEICHLNEARK